MNKEGLRIKKYKLLIISFIGLFVLCLIIQNVSTFRNLNNNPTNNPENSLKTSEVYDSGNTFIQYALIDDTIFIMENAIVTLVNCTVTESIYTFNTGTLFISQNSTIGGDIIISDFSRVNISKSKINGSIECRRDATCGSTGNKSLYALVR